MSKLKTFFFFFSIFIWVFSSAQNIKTDSLKALIEIAVDDTNKVNSIIDLSQIICRSDPNQSIEFAIKAMELAEKLNYQKGVAYALKYIGMGYYFQGDYIQTINFWQQSLNIFELMGDKQGESNMLNNLGAINNNEGDDSRALELYLNSLKVSEEIGDTLRIVTAMINIGLVYLKKPNTHNKALEYYLKALPLSEKINDLDAIGTAAVNLGEIYYENEDYTIALSYFEKSLNAYKNSSSGNVPYTIINIGKVYAKKGEFETAIKFQIEAYEMAKKLDAKLEMAQSLLGLADTYLLKEDYKMALTSYEEAKSIATEIGLNYELRDSYKGLAQTFAHQLNYKNAYKYQSLLTDIKDTLFNISNEKRIGLIQLNYDIDKKQGEIDLLTKDKEIQALAMEKQRAIKNAFLAGLVLVFIIAFIIFRNYLAKVKINKVLDKQKAEIETLLLNILPKKIAKELRRKGSATPRDYQSVSVLFTDFKDFTKISAKLTPAELVAELNDYFIAFDNITEKHNLEKIKTIGDAYMCAGGLPSKNDTHPVDTIKAALEMQEYMQQKNKSQENTGSDKWGLRVGIHTGPIMAGVVGRKKYAYDIWGSTVNVASRMESNGEVGKVNISSATYDLVKDKFKCHYRGKISAKNVGEIDMHFIENKTVTD